MQSSQALEMFGDVIYSYTREQALEDGYLVDVSEMAQEAGFNIPVAVTRDVFDKYIDWNDKDTARQTYQNIEGRLWDVLHMLRMAVRCRPNADTLIYGLYVVPRGGKGRKARLTKLKSVIGASNEHGNPAITIMLTTED